MKYSIGLNTHMGPKKRNEDSILAAVPNTPQNTILLIVADGMGGANAGDVASQQAIQVMHTTLVEEGLPAAEDAAERLRYAIEAANQALFEHGQSSPSLEGMGSTVVAGLIIGRAFWIAHVGDSRAYLIREGTINQLTEDHTWVSVQVKEGRLTAEEAEGLHMGHVLDRALGPDSSVDVELGSTGELGAGDILILCSDGLSNVVDPQTIHHVATSHHPQEAADILVDKALNAPARDNISIVIFRVEST